MNNQNIFKHFFTLLVLLLTSIKISAQTYPVQVAVANIPPHQNFFASYANEDRLKITLTFTDFASPTIQVRLKIRFDSPNFDFESNPINEPAIFLSPGIPYTLSTEELQTYFQLQLPANGPQNYLTEGPSSFCVEVRSAVNNELLNNTSCGYFFLQYGQPAMQQEPLCNSVLTYSVNDNEFPDPITFSFAPPIPPIGLQLDVINTLYIFNYNEEIPQQNLIQPTALISALFPPIQLPVGSNLYVLNTVENQLVRGNKYVWYIHSSLPGVNNQFQNNGWSAPCIFTYDEEVSADENLIDGLSVQWKDAEGTDPDSGFVASGESKAKAKWKVVAEEGANAISFPQYIVSYRKKVEGEEQFDWFHDTVTQLSTIIYQLEPASTYEAYVRGVLGTAETEPTETREITTDSARVYACGLENFPPKSSIYQPLAYADPGMKVQIGMFQLEMTDVQPTGEPGHFAGTGLVAIDFLMGAEAKVRFDDLKIDKDYVVWDGTANVITQGLDAWLQEQYQQFQDPIWVNGTVDSAYVSDSLAHIILDGVDTTFTFPCPTCPVIINDVAGNQVTIYPNGVVVWSTYLDVSDEQLDVPDTEIAVFEQNEDERGGFDPYEHTQWHENYEIIRTSNSVNYFVANKSMHEGLTDKINVSVPNNQYGANDVQLSWQGLTTPLQPTSSSINGNNRIFVFDLPAFDEGHVEIYAKNDGFKIGKLNVVVYEVLEKNIVIVPLAGTVDETQLTTYLNETLGEAGINFTVTISDTVGVGQFSNTTFNVPDATLMTKYGPDMRAVRNAYFESNDEENDTYYLFVVANLQDTVNNNSIDGYMVKGKSVGFITSSTSNITIIHELGHGIGSMEHSWKKDGPEEQTTNNLMDYNNGTNLLISQWEELRDPNESNFWDEEEDFEMANHIAYYFWEENTDGSIKMMPDGKFVNRDIRNQYDLQGYFDQNYTVYTRNYSYIFKQASNDVKAAVKTVNDYFKVIKSVCDEGFTFQRHSWDRKNRSNLLILKNGVVRDAKKLHPDKKENPNDYVVYFNYTADGKLFYSHTSDRLKLNLTGYNQPVYDHIYVIRDFDASGNIIDERVYDFNKKETVEINNRFVSSKCLNIYVNGYIYGTPGTSTDDCQPLGPYWRDAWDNEEQFIISSKKFLNPGIGTAYEFYLNGTGDSYASTASTRRAYAAGKAPSVIATLKKAIKDYAKQGDTITEINIISHSMGAAVAEGYIDKFMSDTLLKRLLMNGRIVHFSACDGDEITIYYTEQLKRCQVNYKGDETLGYADDNPVADLTGGYAIQGIVKKAFVDTDFNNYNGDHDPHYDTKSTDDAWIAVRLLYQNASNGWLVIPHSMVWNIPY